MASSSSSSASASYANNKNYYVYDVFINHRGPDCKEDFATDLYNRLCKHRLRVFLDKNEMRQGDTLNSQIEGAIGTASVHIAIFSPRYAESSWCLKELVLMLKSKATIIPVFYGVHPSELRWTQGQTGLYATVLRMLPWLLCMFSCLRTQNGLYARSLRELQEKKTTDSQTGQQKPRYDPNTIGEWREALFNVADISGFDMETCNGEKRQLIEQVVEGVLKTVKIPLHVSKYPIGLDQKVQDFEKAVSWRRQSAETRVIGIVGLGGIGKTTLAKEIFNRQLKNYDRSCCLSDVREKTLNASQGKLLEDLAGWKGHIFDTNEGMEKIKTYIASTPRALIIFDNVDHIKQLDALLVPLKDTIPSGSLILITSRDKDVLTSSGIAESSIYSLKGLNQQHSEELFCRHAFNQPYPVIGFEEEVGKFLVACGGLPLSLQVIGALLHGKDDLQYWEALRLKSSRIPPEDIRSRLKISYDGLDEEEKHIFLDIACFFIGEDRDRAIRIWNGSCWDAWLGFRNLEHKCLVEVDSQNRITMHDHIRDLGRYIANKEPPEGLRRLWCPKDNILNLSKQSPVRGIIMVPDYRSEWNTQSFKNFEQLTYSLQLLKAEDDCVKNILSFTKSPQLIWLCWYNYRYSSLPPGFQNLRVLQIKGGQLETLWPDESQAPVQITELDINADLWNIPKSIGNLNHLECFLLYHEGHLPLSLKTLPDEFCNLQSLKHLELRYCTAMERLPDSFGNLTNLREINLSHCSGLQMLPNSFGNLTNLTQINLSGCSGLQTLPYSFGNLTNLQSIDMSNCFGLRMLPDSLGNLTNLESIGLFHIFRFNSFGNLTKLPSISIDLSGCKTLNMLPDSFGNLTNLQSIHLSACSGLQMLPDSFRNLTNVQRINLSGCSSLQVLPNSFGFLKSLRELELNFCNGFKCFPNSIRMLSQLRKLKMEGMNNIKRLELEDCRPSDSRDASEVSYREDVSLNLQHVEINDCNGLVEVGALPATLITLNLKGCGALRKIGGLCGLTMLKTFDTSNCKELEELPSIETCVSLEELRAYNCVKLKSIQGLAPLTKLRRLDLRECSELEELPGLEHLIKSLVLCAYGCPMLERCGPVIGQLHQVVKKGFTV